MKPIKAIGARSWLITSADDPPQGVVTFNGMPLLIRKLEPRTGASSNAVIAGPRPRQHTSKPVAQPDSKDPWMDYLKHNPSPFAAAATPARPVDGPIESRFKKQDEKLLQMEQTIAQIKTEQQQLRQHTEQGFQEAKNRDEHTKLFVAKTLDQNKKDIEIAVTRALDKQSTQLTSGMDELKALLAHHPKRGREPEANDMQQD